MRGPQLAARLLSELRSVEPLARDDAAAELGELVGADSERGALPDEDGQAFLAELHRGVPEMLNSVHAHEREGALLAIDALIEAKIDQTEEVGARLSRLVAYLQVAVARAGSDGEAALASCAVVFTRLARVGGALAADTLDAETKRAMEVRCSLHQDSRARRHLKIEVARGVMECSRGRAARIDCAGPRRRA
jgi:hypothetical protein